MPAAGNISVTNEPRTVSTTITFAFVQPATMRALVLALRVISGCGCSVLAVLSNDRSCHLPVIQLS